MNGVLPWSGSTSRERVDDRAGTLAARGIQPAGPAVPESNCVDGGRAFVARRPPDPAAVLRVQRLAGNRSTGRWLDTLGSLPTGSRRDGTPAGPAAESRPAPRVMVQRRTRIPTGKKVQIYDSGKLSFGQVAEREDASGNYRIRMDGDGPAEIRTVHERNVELHPDHHGPKNWHGERTLGALLMQTGSLKDLVDRDAGTEWERLAVELPKSFQGFPAVLATAYYSYDPDNGSHSAPRTELADQGPKNAGLVDDVVAFLENFMEKNGQWPYIERQAWFTGVEGVDADEGGEAVDAAGPTHVIAIDINYYSDRSKDQTSLGFHKDTAGDNIFVNLIFDNQKQIAATEWFPDLEPQGEATRQHQEALQPEAYRQELESAREAGLYMYGADAEISGGLTKGALSYVSWVDDAVWHATPYPESRNTRSADEVIADYEEFETLSAFDHVKTPGSEELENEAALHAEGSVERDNVEFWLGVWHRWVTVLGTLGRWMGSHLQQWLTRTNYSVRDVESWAALAWEKLYRGKKADFEADVKKADTSWRTSHGAAEAIAPDDKVGSKSMRQVPPSAGRMRANSVNGDAVKAAIEESTLAGTPRRFIRTWVRMVRVDAPEILALIGESDSEPSDETDDDKSH